MKKAYTYLASLLAIIFLVFTIFFANSVPLFKESILSLWIVLTLYLGFLKIPDIKEKRIHLTTQNDSTSVHQNLIFGLFIIIGGSLYYYYTKEVNLFLSLLMFQSVLLIFLNFYKKTESKGLSIYIKDENLHYSIGKDQKKVNVQEIEYVTIRKDQIVINRKQQKKNYISFLELSSKEIKDVDSFFKHFLPQKSIQLQN